MLRRLLTGLILMCTFVILGLFSVSGASAHTVPTHIVPRSHVSAKAVRPLSCPYPVGGTNTVATGSTSANVNMTIWIDCNGNAFAGSNSFSDSNGFAFRGTVSIVDIYGNVYSTSCYGAGICDSPHIPASIASYIQYSTTNGQFYYQDGVYYGPFTSFWAGY